MPGDITEFHVEISPDAVADLRDRLARTRWPEAETVDDWSQGIPLAYAQDLCAYWADGYDFAAFEQPDIFVDEVRAFFRLLER